MSGQPSGTPATSSAQGSIGERQGWEQQQQDQYCEPAGRGASSTGQDPSSTGQDTCDEDEVEMIELTNIGVCDGTNKGKMLNDYAKCLAELDKGVYLSSDGEVEGRYLLVCWNKDMVSR